MRPSAAERERLMEEFEQAHVDVATLRTLLHELVEHAVVYHNEIDEFANLLIQTREQVARWVAFGPPHRTEPPAVELPAKNDK